MENKYKHLEFIQSAINRMANNSFYLKGWSITIIAALVALTVKESDFRIYGVAIVLNLVFWFLDSYYLYQEKLFRALYNKVAKETNDSNIDFSMDTRDFKGNVTKIPCIMVWNVSITPLYFSITILLIFLMNIVE